MQLYSNIFVIFCVSCLWAACGGGLSLQGGANKPSNAPFAQLPYHKIMAYGYNTGDMANLKTRPIERIIDAQGQLAATAVLPPVQLSADQAKRLMQILDQRSSYGNGGAKCFIPRMGFALYDQKDSLIGQANICLECEWVRAIPAIPYESQGISAKGLQALSDMCRELGLPACNK